MQKFTYGDRVFTFEGCLSVQEEKDWVMPWRINCQQLGFFPGFLERGAADCAGIRLCFSTNSIGLTLFVKQPNPRMRIALFVDGLFIQEATANSASGQIIFAPLPPGPKNIEILLDHRFPFKLASIGIDNGAVITVQTIPRKRWIHYGGSISRAKMIDRPSKIWSALVAKRLNLNLINLSFDGFCTFEPMIACLIRDQSMDFLTLLLENEPAGNNMDQQLLVSNMIGWMRLIREKHPKVPIAVITPLVDGERKMVEKAVLQVVDIYREYGDELIFQVNGSEIYYLENYQHYDESVQSVLAERFLDIIFFKTFC